MKGIYIFTKCENPSYVLTFYKPLRNIEEIHPCIVWKKKLHFPEIINQLEKKQIEIKRGWL